MHGDHGGAQPLRAAIYARISETNEEFDKVENQERELRSMCADRGYTVARLYVDDGIGAALDDVVRPAYDQLVADVPSGAFDVIVSTFQDRLSRRGVDIAVLLDKCRRAGIVWDFLKESPIDPANPDDNLLAQVKAWQAGREITLKSQRQKLRYNAQRKAGLPLWGVRPFGFESDRITHREAEAAEIRWAYEQVAGGATIYSIIKSWNGRTPPVLTSTGKMWSYAAVQSLLRRPSNAALMVVDGQVDDTIECQWEPIVDRDLWEDVRAKISRDPGEVRRQWEPKWLLAGIAQCGLCSQPLRSSVGSDRKASFKVYRCKRSMLPAIPPEFHEDGKKIRHASGKAELLDALARDAVVAAFMFAPSDLLPSDSKSTADLNRAQAELRAVRDEMNEISASVGKPGFKLATLASRAADLAQREEALQAEVDDLIQRDANSAMMIESRRTMLVHEQRVSLDEAADLKAELEARFDSLPLRQRRQLVANLLDVVVYPGRKPDRFVVWHKAAKSLNPEGAEPPVFLRPVDSHVSLRESGAQV